MANGLFNLKQVVQAVQQGGWPAQKTPAVEYLVVAGGGGSSGGYGSGGGGAGGLLTGLDPVPNGQTILVTVGAGGPGAASSGPPGSNGANSVFGAIVTSGGGGGGGEAAPYAGQSGGSGGGGTANGAFRSGNGIAGQGNAGGTAILSTGAWGGGGGGGAGTVGLFAPAQGAGANFGANGGAGIASDISGTRTAYAGGGGGGAETDTAGRGGLGGVGGGGIGGCGTGGTATSGTANTGGGAGGAGGLSGSAASQNGGSGIVIVSYPDVYAAPTATTGSPTVSTSGSGSSYFNGSTYADYPASTSNYATGDFTIEAWVYYNSFTSGYTLWFSMDPNTTYFGLVSSTITRINLGAGELSWTTSPISLNTWYHTAVVRSGTTITLYINGVSQGTNTSATTLGSGGGAIRIGSASGYSLDGYLSNLRYTKSAVYTSAFTPSTVPLRSLTDTRLLLNTVSPSPFNDSSGIAQKPTVTGTSAWNQLSPFTGTGYKNRVYTWTSSGSITF